MPAYFDDIARDLDMLLPKDFLDVFPIDRIVRIPRQLEALKVRLARARIDPEKDKAKAAQVEPFEFAVERFEAEFAGDTGAGAAPRGDAKVPGGSGAIPVSGPIPLEKRKAVEELRRMVEEFKISLFAPEIKTAFPISAVRLARKIREIEEIV
ncbi:MAG TPA: DUF3418 domain-containing protein [Burkholderiales bacterium]|nr:DUF3418 domain-containing protein [Burkholderiales bacterium]